MPSYLFQRELPQQNHWDLTDLVLSSTHHPRSWRARCSFWRMSGTGGSQQEHVSAVTTRGIHMGCGRAVDGCHEMKMPHVTLSCYLSRMCQENVYTELQTKNTEAADLWRSWVTKGGYPRPSRVSSAAQSAVDDKEVFYHVRLWSSLSLVLGWTNAKLFLQTAHITEEQYGLGKLTLR